MNTIYFYYIVERTILNQNKLMKFLFNKIMRRFKNPHYTAKQLTTNN